MWQTGHGERTLEGDEAIVFAETFLSLLDEAIQDQLDDYQLGVACYDNLTNGQTIAVLATICNGLSRRDVPCWMAPETQDCVRLADHT